VSEDCEQSGADEMPSSGAPRQKQNVTVKTNEVSFNKLAFFPLISSIELIL
jgi:hypothetical protein